MTVKWVNKHYNMNLRKGMRVGFKIGGEMYYGVVTWATHSVYIKPEISESIRLQISPENIIILEDHENIN
jgi:hypothetical protein